MRTFHWCGLVVLLVATSASSQTAARRATNLPALLTHPGFYHLRNVTIVGDVALKDTGELRITSAGTSLPVIFKGTIPDGPAEVRGELWDLGRMNADDPRFAAYDVKRTFNIDPDGPWPRPGQVLAIVASSMAAAVAPTATTVRNVVLFPERYLEQTITLVGQFGGRNLLGDLPDAPARSRYDFVLRSADAALWVTNIRPRGRDFELALDARIDTGRWLEVSGTLQQARGLQWIEAQAGSLKLTEAPRQVTEDTEQIRVPAAPPPEVIFSTPLEAETEVLLSSSVRIQFSRDIDPSTLRNRVRVAYSAAESSARGETDPPKVEFTTQYLPGTRVLEIKFTQPLERFRTLVVELTDGILGSDKQPLAPWTLTFQTGG